MIGVAITGGLGNQMFEYAFAYTNAKRNHTSFFLVKDGLPIELYKYFKLERNFFYLVDRICFNRPSFKMVFSHHLRGYFYNSIRKLTIRKVIHIGNDDVPDSSVFEKDSIFYTGHFQSPLYFKGNEAGIKKMFQVKDNIVARYKQKYKHLADKTVIAVHIRKTDYNDLAHLNLGQKDLSLPLSYFQQVIDHIHQDNYHYLFVSDDVEQVKKHFAHIKNAYFSTDSAINDFLHIYYAQQVIISNSTFSWWAAYLNTNPEKKIYCPKYFLGYAVKREYPAKIYPADWTQIEVNDPGILAR